MPSYYLNECWLIAYCTHRENNDISIEIQCFSVKYFKDMRLEMLYAQLSMIVFRTHCVKHDNGMLLSQLSQPLSYMLLTRVYTIISLVQRLVINRPQDCVIKARNLCGNGDGDVSSVPRHRSLYCRYFVLAAGSTNIFQISKSLTFFSVYLIMTIIVSLILELPFVMNDCRDTGYYWRFPFFANPQTNPGIRHVSYWSLIWSMYWLIFK